MYAVNSREMLSDIIENHLHSIHGVSHTETFVVLKNLGMPINAENYYQLLMQSNNME